MNRSNERERSRFLLPIVALALVVFASFANAHPFGKLAFDRTITVELRPTQVRLIYQLEVESLFIFQTVTKLDPDIDLMTLRSPKDFNNAFLRILSRLLPDQLWAKTDQQTELTFKLVSQKSEIREDGHLVAEFVFYADHAFVPGSHSIRVKDFSFEHEPGLIAFAVKPTDGITIESSELPTKEETIDERRRVANIAFKVIDTTPNVEEPPPPAPEPPVEIDWWEQLHRQGLPALFDTNAGLGFLLLIAALFGAAHALTPGHGKTLVAAYLIGERGTMFHAWMLGLIVTLTHTGSVIAVALVLRYFYPDTMPHDVQVILGFVGGLLIAGLGFWMLLRRLGGQADHVHVFGGHHHETQSVKLGKAGWIRLTMLGISGGIVPCTDAIALLGIAITAGRIALAVPLLLAFSAGLAAVLVALGMAVVYAQRYGINRFRERRWFRALPIVSAAILLVLGLWICKASLRVP